MLGILNEVAQGGGGGGGKEGERFCPKGTVESKVFVKGIYKKILVHSPWLVLH